MPSEEANKKQWDGEYDWPDGGEEWSRAWGGTDSLWWGAIYPRIRSHLRAKRILEIAPGYGRFTQYLKDQCESLVVVDLSNRCIEACAKRFADSDHISYYVNDGRSLEMVEDGSIDFVFSFDSLVHAEADVLETYLNQLKKKLTPTGAGFIHHSNIGAYGALLSLTKKAPKPLLRFFVKRGLLVNVYAWRAENVTADLVKSYCVQADLHCVSQELINWNFGRHVIDCLTVFSADAQDQEYRLIRNADFMEEAHRLRALADLYSKSNGDEP